MGPRAIFSLSFAIASVLVYGACGGKRERREYTYEGSGGDDPGSTTSGFVSDGASICGSEEHTGITTYPLLYFVLDRSGSMAELENGETRYAQVRAAAVEMTSSLGALVRVGAAVFPDPDADFEADCVAGTEVYAPTVAPKNGFAAALNVQPFGGTPTAGTLRGLLPSLSAAGSPKVVLLATDGAPNCNEGAQCEPDQCMVNLVGQCPAGVANCCVEPDGTPLNCVDRLPTLQAILDLREAGVVTHVIGVPGSEMYATILDQMALAGGAPQVDAETYYYRIDDLGTLAGLFKEIAAGLVSCTFDLTDPPEEQGLTNVYFDEQVVVQDPENGWIWTDADTIELVGAACAQLKSGGVQRVQFVSGCPTVTPN